MLNIRNHLDKIIITAMDRFVWFVLLVVISHLVTEFTRVTGHTRGSRQDVVMVNDSSIQQSKVQNLVMYPGQEYGHFEQQNQQYYNGNNLYSNYANNKNYNQPNANTNNSNRNFLSSLLNQFAKTNNKQNSEEHSEMSSVVNSNNKLLSFSPSGQEDGKTFSFRPLIDSIFEIPISTLRAVNELVGRLTGGFLQSQQKDQQQPTKSTFYPYYPYYPASNLNYGMPRTAGAIQPKTQYEMLNENRPTTAEKLTPPKTSVVAPTVTSAASSRKPAHNAGLHS